MPPPLKASDEEIAKHIKAGLTVTEICKAIGFKSVASHTRIHQVADKFNLTVAKAAGHKSPEERAAETSFQEKLRHNARKHINVTNGTVLVGSDAHYWPGIKSTAHRAFVKFAAELKPEAVVMNGDASDGAQTSRYPRIGWDSRPTVLDELKACQESMGEIEAAARTKKLFWPLGNHDARFETFLAAKVPEFQGVDGFHLKDHFPFWTPCWSVWINDHTVIKHRYKSGIHAPHNNAMWAGKTMVTGHLHSLKVQPLTDYGGTRYGVDCGTLADPSGPQFVDYLEDNPVNWRSGFAVLTFHNGRLLWPEVVHVIGEDQVEFRGQVLSV